MAKKKTKRYSLGVDYGSNSARALIVDLDNGDEIGTAVVPYPSGKQGILLDEKQPDLARQNPADYIKCFIKSVKLALKDAASVSGFSPEAIMGIGVDTTGSTPIPVDAEGMPLAMNPKYEKHLAAQAWLWKDHTSHEEAAEITALAKEMKRPYLAKCGGTYSSEWFWSKILHCRRSSPRIFEAAYSWVELADFVPAYITGNLKPDQIVRGICAAGHKAMFNEEWGGLPDEEFLSDLDPELAKLRARLYDKAVPSDQLAGELTKEMAKKTGLRIGLPVAVGAFDAHHGAVGAGIKPGTLVKIMGTSTCDIMLADAQSELPDISGLCGIVNGSVTPGAYGLEAGQSAVGDIFNWFASELAPQSMTRKGDVHVNLTQAAAGLKAGESGLLALDWNNGNRTVLVDQRLSGLLIGQNLHTSAAEVYRALVEATAFGALTIINRFEEFGVQVKEVVNCGGIAEKNAMVMQIYANICNRPMKISRSAQTCALGAAIYGAVAAGAFKDVKSAQRKMTGVKPKVYRPQKKEVAVYQELYQLYMKLHDALGGVEDNASLGELMKELMNIRDRVRK